MKIKKVEQLMLEEVQIIFKNFTGTKSTYNAEGERNFSVIFDDPEYAKDLIALGWNVRVFRQTDEDDPIQYHMSVKVNYAGHHPPRVFAVKASGALPLEESTIAMLDWTPIKYCDVVINPYKWTVNEDSGIKAYLNTLYAVVDENKFDIKHAGVPPICIGCEEDEDVK